MERTSKNGLAAAFALALAATLGLAGCSGGSQQESGNGQGDAQAQAQSAETPAAAEPAGSGGIPLEDKVAAKAVIKGASNVFTTTATLTLTDADSPAVISMDDPQFSAFFDELLAYRDVADHAVDACSFDVAIMKVTTATAREDSTQTNYRYLVNGADMVVDGHHITWDKNSGFSED